MARPHDQSKGREKEGLEKANIGRLLAIERSE
jgi:hypothetical protein